MNNREKATLIWLAIALAAALTNREIRGALWQVVKSFAQPKVLGPVLSLAGWTVGLVAVAHAVDLWKPDVRNDTVTWFITVGMVFYFSLDKVTEGGFFGKTARRAVAATVFAEGFVNLAVFPLAAELALLPLVTFLVMLVAFSDGKEEYAPAHGFLNGLLSIVGGCFFVYAAVRLAEDFDAGHTLRALVLPVWLALGVMPFIYGFGLLAEYQQAFLRIDRRTDDPSNRRRAKRSLLRAANVRASELAGFTGHWIWDLASAESSHEAQAVMQRWREAWRSEQRASRLSGAREFMREWLTQTDPALAEIHADALLRSWERLDAEQRAAPKAEGRRLAPRALADDLRALPD